MVHPIPRHYDKLSSYLSKILLLVCETLVLADGELVSTSVHKTEFLGAQGDRILTHTSACLRPEPLPRSVFSFDVDDAPRSLLSQVGSSCDPSFAS
jgi:hypothetical protein